jgi:hypothetical protein
LPLVYDELRKLAAQKLAQEKPGQTMQATALIYEAYLRMVGSEKDQHGDSRGHFRHSSFSRAARPYPPMSARYPSTGWSGGLMNRGEK